MIEHLLKLPHIRLIAGVFFIFASIFSPFSFYFQFSHSFQNYDIWKMIFVSFGTGFPPVVFQTFFASAALDVRKFGGDFSDNLWYYSAIIGSVFSAFPFYLPMIDLMSQNGRILTFKSASALVVKTEVVCLLLFLLLILLGTFLKGVSKRDKKIEVTEAGVE
jgi:hypothetical protein